MEISKFYTDREKRKINQLKYLSKITIFTSKNTLTEYYYRLIPREIWKKIELVFERPMKPLDSFNIL